MKSPVTLLSCLLDDVRQHELSVKGLDRDVQTIQSRFKHEGYGFLSVALSSLCDALDKGISTGSFTCPTAFSKRRGEALPKFLSGLLCKVFDTKTGQLLELASSHAIKCLREILRLFKKVKLRPKQTIRLDCQARAKFVETDARIQRHLFDIGRTDFLRAAARVLLPNLDEFDSGTLLYKHGPGGVAEKVKANIKWVGLLEACRQDVQLSKLLGIDLGFFTETQLDSYQDSISGLPLFESSTYRLNSTQQYAASGVAKLLTVYKDSTSRRTITAEPVLKQYWQQGLNTYLRDRIKECGVLSQSLTLSDQSKNQELAMEGSLTGKYATLDLSSASDLLSNNLVGFVFGRKHVFYQHMVRSRSPYVDVGQGQHLLLEKFAGMGNALTFPVQSVVFATLAICAMLEQDGKEPSYVNMRRAASKVRVYGDDIIVDTHYAHRVVDWLVSFGLIVNQKKSFLVGYFKESCGVDAYRGIDVTPVYLRCEPVITERDPETIGSLTSASNQLFSRGLYRTAEYLRGLVNSFIRLPLVSSKSSSLGWHSRVDTTVAQKWDGKLQRLVFRGQLIEPLYNSDDISDEDAALLKALSTLERRGRVLGESGYEPVEHQLNDVISDPKNLERSVRRFKTRIRGRWVPAHAG